MKNLLLIVLLISMSSCLTVRKIQKNCDKFSTICIVEKEIVRVIEYRDTVIYRKDTILVPLPVRDTVTIRDTVRIGNDGLVYLPEVHKEFGIIGVDAEVYQSILNIKAYLTDSNILHIENDTVYVTVKEETIHETDIVEVVPPGYKWALAVCLTLLLFTILTVVYKIKKL